MKAVKSSLTMYVVFICALFSLLCGCGSDMINKDPKKRLSYAKNTENKTDLIMMMLKDNDSLVRDTAIKRLVSNKQWNEYSKQSSGEYYHSDIGLDVFNDILSKYASGNDKFLVSIVMNQDNQVYKYSNIAISHIKDQNTLYQIATLQIKGMCGGNDATALASLTDQKYLFNIATSTDPRLLSLDATRKITDINLLKKIIKIKSKIYLDNKSIDAQQIIIAAITQTNDQDFLKSIFQDFTDDNIRETAVKRIQDDMFLLNIARNETSRAIKMAAIAQLVKQGTIKRNNEVATMLIELDDEMDIAHVLEEAPNDVLSYIKNLKLFSSDLGIRIRKLAEEKLGTGTDRSP